MSYCRWSSDDHQSDIYCYESHSGYEVHIAGNRIVDRSGAPPPLDWSGDFDAWKWADHSMAVSAWLKTEPTRERISHRCAGQGYTFADAGGAADFIEQISSEGIYVPDGVVEALRDDQAEADEDES